MSAHPLSPAWFRVGANVTVPIDRQREGVSYGRILERLIDALIQKDRVIVRRAPIEKIIRPRDHPDIRGRCRRETIGCAAVERFYKIIFIPEERERDVRDERLFAEGVFPCREPV